MVNSEKNDIFIMQHAVAQHQFHTKSAQMGNMKIFSKNCRYFHKSGEFFVTLLRRHHTVTENFF